MLRKIKTILLRNTKYGKSRYLNFLYRYDMQRYLNHSCMNGQNIENTATRMRILVHAIEKGMSLSSVKAGFGKEKIEDLVKLYRTYEQQEYRKDEQVLALVRSTVRMYAEYQSSIDADISFIPCDFLELCRKQLIITGPVEIERGKATDFAEAAKRSHSIRSYSKEKINLDHLRQAVHLAQTAPSACNRQATHIYVCQSEEYIKKIFALHGGLSGFDMPSAILVVTGDLNLYQNEYERNTVFVDGGIFLMNLLYALDYYQIGACPVIWGAEPDNDKTIYNLLGIPESQEIISLVVVGTIPDVEVKAARSFKRPTETILHFIEP